MDSNIMIVVVSLLIGLSKGGLGGPVLGALIAPLLSQTMTVSQAVGVTLPLLMFADLFALRLYWRKWDIRIVRLLLPGAVVGILLGILLLTSLPDEVLRRLLAIISLVTLIYKFVSDMLKSLAYKPRNWHGYLAGWASGFGSALANTGAPPFTAYMLLQKVTPTAFIGTATLFFALVNAMKLPIFLTAQVIDIPGVIHMAWVLPIIPVGAWVGRKSVDWINPKAFEWLMIVLLVWVSFALLFGKAP